MSSFSRISERTRSQLALVLLIKQFPDLFIEEYSHFVIDGLGHLATHFDLFFKGKYSYGDRFRVVFRALAKLTQFRDSSVHNLSTKVAILDE